MKHILGAAVFIFFSALTYPVAAQSSVLFEDFAFGYPSGRLLWEGDTADFEANAAGQLHLLSQGAKTSETFTPFCTHERMRWRTWARLSFNSSAANYATLLLLTDSSGVMRLRLQLGGADDRLRLLASVNGVDSTLMIGSSVLFNLSVNAIYLEVLYLEGIWLVRSSADGLSWNSEGQCQFPLSGLCGFTGFSCTYTSSNSNRFYFDDFLCEPLWPDTLPPFLVSWGISSPGCLLLRFSEALDPICLDASNFRLDGVLSDSIYSSDAQAVSVYFSSALPQCTYLNLSVLPLADSSGNWSLDTGLLVYQCQPKYADVQISEVMPDPSPAVGLPDAEYIELFNRSRFPVNLKGWTLQVGSINLKFSNISIDSSDFLLLLKDNSNSFPGDSIETAALSGLSLPNDGADLTLRDSLGRVIHYMHYAPEFYSGTFKREGGWSLERCDPEYNAEGGNWSESSDLKGGSPGRPNSCRKSLSDTRGPRLIHAEVADPWTIELYFDESLDSSSLPAIHNFHLTPFGSPSWVGFQNPAYNKIQVRYNESFIEAEQMQFSCSGQVRDLHGNLNPDPISWRVALGAQPLLNDLIINEILFDESEGGAEFIEVMNAGLGPIDLSHTMLCSYDSLSGLHTPITLLSEGNHTLFPGELRYFSNTPDLVATYYEVNAFPLGLKMKAFPSLANTGGCFSLVRTDGLCIDSICYDPSWHHKALIVTKGISLERIAPSLNGLHRGSWHSAAHTTGGATPGMPNSQNWMAEASGAELRVSPDVISPDLDGFEDYLVLSWSEMAPESFLEVEIVNLQGHVEILLFAGPCGSNGLVTWKGTDDAGNQLPAGHYVLKAVVMDNSGRRLIKKAVGIRYR